jgi:hypothetical protein
VLDRGAVENLVECLAIERPIEDVGLEEFDALVMEGPRNGELVESDHLVTALGSGEGEEADVGAEIERAARLVRKSRQAE